MEAEHFNELWNEPTCTLYELTPATLPIRRLLASTPGTRSICNDPLVVGVEYTDALMQACAATLTAMQRTGAVALVEAQTAVLHILRGGLNFGLRQALAKAFGWNRHASAFISAQRARNSDDPQDWYISENEYRKINLPPAATIVFGDVVATGTSLLYALRQILDVVDRQQTQVRELLFFCIGGSRAEEILIEIDAICRERFPVYRGAAVIYLEGRFSVAHRDSGLSVMIPDTDLLRTGASLAPEFIRSQVESPSYPLERCTIYDAGSRAFWLPEYFYDVRDYWLQTLALAEDGMTYAELLRQRLPELDSTNLNKNDLGEVCRKQLERIPIL